MNGVGKTGGPHWRRMELDLYLAPCTLNLLQMVQRPRCETQNTETTRRLHRNRLHLIGVGKDFLMGT